jgi:hypothetical protein
MQSHAEIPLALGVDIGTSLVTMGAGGSRRCEWLGQSLVGPEATVLLSGRLLDEAPSRGCWIV